MTYATVSYKEFSANPTAYLSKLRRAGASLVITRPRGRPLMVKAMDETEYLLSSPANAKALQEALQEPVENYIHYESVEEFKEKFGVE